MKPKRQIGDMCFQTFFHEAKSYVYSCFKSNDYCQKVRTEFNIDASDMVKYSLIEAMHDSVEA